jgi:hypothetical protein
MEGWEREIKEKNNKCHNKTPDHWIRRTRYKVTSTRSSEDKREAEPGIEQSRNRWNNALPQQMRKNADNTENDTRKKRTTNMSKTAGGGGRGTMDRKRNIGERSDKTPKSPEQVS